MPHKFILGQAVEYTPPRRLYAPPGIYVVTVTNALREKASFMRSADEARQHARVGRIPVYLEKGDDWATSRMQCHENRWTLSLRLRVI
jgi:hypothetical protein